jgi:hypothetical protein
MSVLMIMEGGPLDGEEQVVQQCADTPGQTMTFFQPSRQTFDQDGNVVAVSLQSTYAVVQEGRPPKPGDVWDKSWVLTFVGQEYPNYGYGPIQPSPPHTDIPGPQVFMLAGTAMIVNANDPTPGVFMEADASMTVEGDVQPYVTASVSMDMVAYMTIDGDSTPNRMDMTASTSMVITPDGGTP